jgi:hypothetical protein
VGSTWLKPFACFPRLCFAAMWANASCMLYKGKLSGKVYIGCTKLPLQERLQNMKTKPVSWLRGHKDLQKLRLTHLCDRRVPEAKALALEAAFTAEQWQGNPGEVRGGPYCLARLPGAHTSQLRLLSTSLEGKSLLKERVEVVEKVAASLPKRSALCRHLRGECYKCGGKFARCSCRIRSVGFHEQETPPRRRSGRSGTSKSGSWKRKQKYKQNQADPDCVRLKWGGDVVTNRENDNDEQQRKNPHRKHRKRG